MLNCKEISELSSRSLDSRLPWNERMQMKLHLMMCKACKQYLKQLKFLRKSTKALDFHFQDIALSNDARFRISEHLKSAQE